ncbi:MAG: RHS repeat-associated core domain-containing protein [Minisyncoccia bacterium]
MQTIDYYPYGDIRQNTNATSFDIQRKYIGELYDDTAQLSYLNARYYNPSTGQFVSQDPVFWELGLTKDGAQAVQQPQAQNSYGYAGGNPIGRKDSSGRCSTVAMAVACGLLMPDFESGEPVGSNIYQQSPTQNAENALFVAGFMTGGTEKKVAEKSLDTVTVRGIQVSKEAAEFLMKGEPASVYKGLIAGVERYVGIAKDVAKRQFQHGGRFDRLQKFTDFDTRNQARAVEEAFITAGGGAYQNLISSISFKNPIYQEVVNWGQQVIIQEAKKTKGK